MIPALLKPKTKNPDGIMSDDTDHLHEEIIDSEELTYASSVIIKKNNSNSYDSTAVRSVFGSDIDKLNEFLVNYNTSLKYDIIKTTKLINSVYKHLHRTGGIMHLCYMLKTNDVYINIKLRAMLKIFYRTIVDGYNVGIGEVEVVASYDDKPILSVDFFDDESYRNMTSWNELMRLYDVIGVRETIRYFVTLLSVL